MSARLLVQTSGDSSPQPWFGDGARSSLPFYSAFLPRYVDRLRGSCALVYLRRIIIYVIVIILRGGTFMTTRHLCSNVFVTSSQVRTLRNKNDVYSVSQSEQCGHSVHFAPTLVSNRCQRDPDNSNCKSYRCTMWTGSCWTACVATAHGTRRIENAHGTSAIPFLKFAWRNTSQEFLLQGPAASEWDLRLSSEGIPFLSGALSGMINPGLFCPSVLPGRWVGEFKTTFSVQKCISQRKT